MKAYTFFFLIFFIFRERWREGERSMCGCLSHAPYWGSGLQHRHVPWLGLNRSPFGAQVGIESTEPYLSWPNVFTIYIFKDFIYLLLERRETREKERERNIDVWEITSIGCFSHPPNWGPGPKPRHVPWLRIEPATFWFAGRHSEHWTIPARAWRPILPCWALKV